MTIILTNRIKLGKLAGNIGSGSGGGTSNYSELEGKPQIEGNTLLSGNNTASSLGLQKELTFDTTPTLDFDNPVTLDGIKKAIDLKQNILIAGDGIIIDDDIVSISDTEEKIKPPFSYIKYPEIHKDYAKGSKIEVSTEPELLQALIDCDDFDTIELIDNITLTNTLNINKSVTIDGEFTLQSAGTSSDPVILMSITANNVVITDKVTIKHRKTSNVSLETAINVNANNFVSKANVEFMEFGYVLRGSFNVEGNIKYTGVAGNSNRAIAIYKILGDSRIDNVKWDFTNNATPVSNFVFLGYQTSGDTLDYNLKVSNCFQIDITKRGRQFIFYEVLTKSINATPSLIAENNRFNCLNGDIGFAFSSTRNISFFDYIALFNNWAGSAGYDAGSYKGLCFCDGSGSLRSLGTAKIYTSGNKNYPVIRLANDYSSAIGKSVVVYKNTTFINDVPLVKEENIQNENSQYNWIKNLDDAINEVITDNTLSGKGTAEDPLRVTFESSKWNVVSEGEQDLLSNNGYITNGTDSSSFTLPVISEVGDTISISAHTSYGWRLNQRVDQQIFYGDIACTLGVDGFVQSTSMGDSIHMVCVVANTTWRVVNSQGNIQYV